MSDKPLAVYHTSLEWTAGNQGIIHSPKKTDIEVTCPPPFCDVDDLWSPEEFYVGAIEMCLMMTFLWFAKRANLPFLSYKSCATGVVETQDKKTWFSKVTIQPRIEVADESTAQKAETLLRGASRNCLISASVKTEVVLEPEIVVVKEADG